MVLNEIFASLLPSWYVLFFMHNGELRQSAVVTKLSEFAVKTITQKSVSYLFLTVPPRGKTPGLDDLLRHALTLYSWRIRGYWRHLHHLSESLDSSIDKLPQVLGVFRGSQLRSTRSLYRFHVNASERLSIFRVHFSSLLRTLPSLFCSTKQLWLLTLSLSFLCFSLMEASLELRERYRSK